MRPSFAHHHAKKDSPPARMIPKSGCPVFGQDHAHKRGKRSAERRMPSMSADRRQCARTCATYLLRGCAHPLGRAPAFRRSRLRHSPPATTPMAQPQNRVSPRLRPRGVLPAMPRKLPRVKHAPCGPVFLPVDRGPRAARERMAYPPRGHRPSLPSFRLALPERRPL